MPIFDLLWAFVLSVSTQLPSATLAGQVRTADGTPVPEVLVALVEGREHRPVAEAATDARGRYRLTGLRLGPRSGWLRVGKAADAFTVTIAPGANSLDLVVARSVLRGRVLGPDGAPVEGAEVLLRSAGRDRTALSGADGAFAFLAAAGSYELSARRIGFVVARLAEPVQLPAGALLERELELGRGAALSGRLVGLDPEELAGTTVQVERGGWEPRLAALAEEDGSFALDGLTPGTWWVRSFRHGRHAEKRVVLVAGQETFLDLPFPYHRLRGRVVDDEGHPVADRELRFTADGESASIRTSARGRFEIELHDGVYTVVATAEPEGREGRGEPLAAAELLTVDGALGKGCEIRLLTTASELHGRILGLAPEEQGATHIFLERVGFAWVTEPDAAGSYSFGGLLPGTWRVSIAVGEALFERTVEIPQRGSATFDLAVRPDRR
jgi:carboxypeptidase family protein